MHKRQDENVEVTTVVENLRSAYEALKSVRRNINEALMSKGLESAQYSKAIEASAACVDIAKLIRQAAGETIFCVDDLD